MKRSSRALRMLSTERLYKCSPSHRLATGRRYPNETLQVRVRKAFRLLWPGCGCDAVSMSLLRVGERVAISGLAP